MENKFITTTQAAKIAGVTSETIRNVAKAGAIAYRMRNHMFYVSQKDVEKYAATISDIQSITTDIEELKQALVAEQAELNDQLEAMHTIYRERMLNIEMFPKRIGVIRDFLYAVLASLSRYVDMEDCGISHREWDVMWEALQGKSFEDIGKLLNPSINGESVRRVWMKALRKIGWVRGSFEHLQKENDNLKKEVQALEEKLAGKVMDDQTRKMSRLLATDVWDLDLPIRVLNCLRCADIQTVRDIVNYKRADLLKFRNFGKRSVTELDEWLENHGLHFGMDVSSIPEYVK